MRKYSFFSLHPKIPASIICYIIYNFILVKLNASQIFNMVKDKYKSNTTIDTIRNILLNIRKTIANAIKHVCRSEHIGGPPEANKIVVIDESLFLHDS